METKLYVGNLSYNTTDEDLRELFAQAGTVKSVTVMRDRDTGRSRGFAFVEMDSNEEATKAISLFNEREFQDRSLTVNIARPREERSGGGGFRSGGGDRGGFAVVVVATAVVTVVVLAVAVVVLPVAVLPVAVTVAATVVATVIGIVVAVPGSSYDELKRVDHGLFCP
jgi:RNA recognition motif-containing protein